MFGQNLDFSAIVHGRKKSVSYRFTPDDFPTFYWVKTPSLFSIHHFRTETNWQKVHAKYETQTLKVGCPLLKS